MQEEKTQKVRRLRIDAFRLYAMFLIVCAHIQFCETFGDLPPLEKIPRLLVIIFTRFAIPYFFIISGYFVGGKITEQPQNTWPIALKYIKRIAIIFIFWSAVYAVVSPQNFFDILKEEPLKLLFELTKSHLWFLPALIITICIFILWPFRYNRWSFLILGSFLFVMGLLDIAYLNTPIGIDLPIFCPDTFFFGPLFFSIGILLRYKTPSLRKITILFISVGGFIFFILEAYCLHTLGGVTVSFIDYLIGSVPFGIGISLLAFTQPDSSIDKFIGPYGRYTLGVYAGHMLFVDLLHPLGLYIQPLLWQILFPIAAFGLSLITSMLLGKTFLRQFVV